MHSIAQFGFDKGCNCFWLSFPGFEQLQFSPMAEIDGVKVCDLAWSAIEDQSGDAGESIYRAGSAHGSWELGIRACGGASSLTLTLKCHLAESAGRVSLSPLVLRAFPASHVLCHGRSMGGCDHHLLSDGMSETIESASFIAITRDTTTLQLSHPLVQGHLSRFVGAIVGRSVDGLAASTDFNPCLVRLLTSETVTIAASGKGHELMLQWAGAQISDRQPLPIPQESGWNSWDYYRWTISEDEVLKNAEFIAADPVLSKHVKRVVIDDGWQYCYGEWEANCFFPSGMESLSQKLNRMGFVAGLWIAPTIVEPHSRLAQLEPEMMAMGISGLPCLAFNCMQRQCLILDPTRASVQQWWGKLFRRYAQFGYRYFKLDFLGATLNAPRFADPSVPRGEMMRKVIEPIREAVGPESRILGCNYRFEGGVGLVDDVRVSADIHVQWSSVKENVSSIAARFWSHGRFWINDPDFAVCRGEETSDDPDLHRLKPLLVFVKPETPEPGNLFSSLVALSLREAEVLLSLVIISGGAMNLSDNLPKLNAAGLRLARQAVSAEKGEAAIPLDLFTSKYPSYWAQKLASGLHRILIINWSEQAGEYSIDLGELNFPTRTIRDFWSDQMLKVSGGRLSVQLAPHSCLLAELKG